MSSLMKAEVIDPRRQLGSAFGPDMIVEDTRTELAYLVVGAVLLALLVALGFGLAQKDQALMDKALNALVPYGTLVLGWYFGKSTG